MLQENVCLDRNAKPKMDDAENRSSCIGHVSLRMVRDRIRLDANRWFAKLV